MYVYLLFINDDNKRTKTYDNQLMKIHRYKICNKSKLHRHTDKIRKKKKTRFVTRIKTSIKKKKGIYIYIYFVKYSFLFSFHQVFIIYE